MTMRGVLLTAVAGVALAWATTTPAAALVDTHGREWRQLYETTGLSFDQVAAVCPRDGVTPCAGTAGAADLSRWVWATREQVRELLTEYAPGLATAEPPALSGPDVFFNAMSFLGVMRWTTF